MSENTLTQNCYIYLNLHSKPKTFSVQINGLVQKNIPAGIATDARFHVRTGGHAQAVKEQVRNVHAFVVCQEDNLKESDPLYRQIKSIVVPVHYHYNDGDFFSVKWNEKWMPLDQDYVFDRVYMDDHKCYIRKTAFWEYLLKRKLTVKQLLDVIAPELTDVLIENIQYILKVKKVSNNEQGICSNLQSRIYNDLINEGTPFTSDLEEILDVIFDHCFASWPKFSGVRSYPIYVGDENPSWDGAFAQYLNEPKWTGTQGEHRFELLEHMLQVIEN